MVQQYEKRYANEFLNEHFADKHWQPRVWLGQLPPGKEAREYMVTGRWADAIVFEPTLVTIIEFKLEPKPDAVGQLDLYAEMFPKTQRFQQYWDRGIAKMLVTTRVDDNLQQLCEAHNIEYRVFRPEWIDYWETIRFRLPGYKKISTPQGSQ